MTKPRITQQGNLFQPIKVGDFYEGICGTCGQWYHGRGKQYCSYKCRANSDESKQASSKRMLGKPSLSKGKPHPLGSHAADPLRRWERENGIEFRPRSSRRCKTCGEPYQGKGKRYCSNQCRSNDPEVIAKVALANTGKPSWNKGMKGMVKQESIEALKKWVGENGVWNKGTRGVMKPNSGSFTTERTSGPNSNNWKGGISGENSRIRSSKEYAEWRKAVFQRDRFTCIICGHRSKYDYRKGEKCDIRADHIKPFCKFPELRFDVDNGRTLCLPCDLKHGWNNLRDAGDEYQHQNIVKKSARGHYD